MKSFLRDTYTSFVNEAKIIFADFGILLVASAAIIIYGFIYSYAYSPEVLHRVPTVIVDLDQSELSQRFVEAVSSSPSIDVCAEVQNLEQAKELVLDREAYAILYLERDFGERILSNETAYFSSYSDASYFLAYKQFFMATNEVMLQFNKDIKQHRYMMGGASYHDAQFLSQPVDFSARFLYNKSQGYGSFLMPAILMLIIQQTILIACGMVFGKAREHGALPKLLFGKDGRPLNSAAIVLGRSIYYTLSNLLTWSIVLALIYPTFGLIDNGNVFETMLFVLPYILSSAFLGIFISTLLKQRESSILYIFFSSIPFLFLSGISWPMDGMPAFWTIFARLIPSTSAIEGFATLETMGAGLEYAKEQFYTLWLMVPVTFIAAWLRYRHLAKR